MPQIPTADIDAEALPRDRTHLDDTALTELRLSIATHGLRTPIEVFPTNQGYALISGFRRLAAIRALHALTQNPAYASIPATILHPKSIPEALTLMVEENDIRADLSPWEKGRIAVAARNEGHFATIDAAIAALYPNATKMRRSRLRALALLVEELDGHLTAPGRPRRAITPRRGLTVRRELAPEGWVLRFTGPEATGMLMETVMDEVERLVGL